MHQGEAVQRVERVEQGRVMLWVRERLRRRPNATSVASAVTISDGSKGALGMCAVAEGRRGYRHACDL